MKPGRNHLVTATLNGHVGLAFQNGALGVLIEEHRPDIIAVQEAHSRGVPRMMSDMRGQPRYVGAPFTTSVAEQKQVVEFVDDTLTAAKRVLPMTRLIWRRRRFQYLGVEQPDISFGEKGPDGQIRVRELTAVRLFDRATERIIVAASVHVAPLGKGFEHANPAARKIHEQQVQAYADRMARVRPGRVALALGDWNEHLGSRLPSDLVMRSAEGRMGEAGLTFLYRTMTANPHLDDIAYRPDIYLVPVSREVMPIDDPQADHPAVIGKFVIKNKG